MKSVSGTFEKKLFKTFIVISVFIHGYLLIVGIDWSSIFEEQNQQNEELVIETDLVFSSGDSLEETSLDNAKVSEQVAVQKQTLPQLTKEMKDAVVSEESQQDKLDVKVSKDDMPVPEQSIKEQKEKIAKEFERKEQLKKQRKEAAKKALLKNLKEEEIKRRLAREKLREQQKLASEDQTLRKKLLSRGKQLENRLSAKNSQLSDEATEYISRWKSKLTKNFSVPALYESSMKNKNVVLGFRIDSGGKFKGVEIIEGSGDDSIDALLKQAAEKTAGIGRPPQNIVGRMIHINYTF